MAAVGVPASPVEKPRKEKHLARRFGDKLYPYGYIGPAIAFMVVGSFIPLVYTVYLSMTNYGQNNITSFDFVGLENYKNIFTGTEFSVFIGVFEWTIVFAAVSTFLNFCGGLFLAYLLNNENMRERNLYRTVLIIPWALPGTIAILAFRGIFTYQFGLLSTALQHLGVSFASQPYWLGDAFWARILIIVLNFWLGFPFMMTACLGALQSLSPEVLQAAEIDGANPIQKFFRVTFPLLRASTLPLLISTFAFNLNNFGIVYLFTGGNPPTSAYAGATDILPSYVYKLGVSNEFFGVAAAYAVVIFIIIGGLSSVNMKLSGAFTEAKR